MLRRLAAPLAVLALAAAAPAWAQEEDEDAAPVPAPPACARGPGTDADYAYCADPCASPDGDYQDDADYVYCDVLPTAAPPPAKRRETPAVRPLAARAGTLPLTGTDPRFVAVFGIGLLLAGAGLRLSTAPGREPGQSSVASAVNV